MSSLVPKPKKKDKPKSVDLLTVKGPEIGPTVLLDSSFVLALLNPRDLNHTGVKSVFGFLEPHNCRFHVPIYVFAEVVSKIIHNEGTVSNALKRIEKFLKQLHGIWFVGSNPSMDIIVKRYKDLARKKVRFLQSNDFLIATEGMLSKSLILTCDSGMYEKVKQNYPDIYFVATNSKKYINDIPKFTKRLLSLRK